MNPQRKPPTDIEPQAFYQTWLPKEIERLGSAAGLPPTHIRIMLEGHEGGTWELFFRQGTLHVEEGRPGPDVDPPPRVTLQLSVDDWRAVMVGHDGRDALMPPNASPTDFLFIDAHCRRILATLSGSFLFQIHYEQEQIWRLQATFNQFASAAPPEVTLSTDAATYTAIMTRTLSAPEAVLAGQVTVSGDMTKGMQLGQLLLGKF